MYDYVSVYSDQHYSKKIRTEVIEAFFVETLHFERTSRLKFSKMICGELVTAKGISANQNGNYAFDTLDDVKEINLIEIDIPQASTGQMEEEIEEIVYAIAKEFSWIVDLRE
ncbi:hypothetical protein ABEW34_27615 [Paenibacillus algorifonticola]|uniref:hypothetical protein n=1 Tax=Paenibacillus algorifonticola TaxID=684063 RepID=UPI003D2C6103